MRPSQSFHVLETLRNSSSALLCRKGVELSSDDNQTTLDVYQQWLLLMLDLDYLHPETLKRDARRLLSDMIRVDVLDLNNAFAECLQHVRVQDNKGFKALCSKISPHLYIFIKDDWDRVLGGDVIAARRLIQAFSYTSRLSLNDLDLTQQQLDDYLEIEDSMPLSFPDSIVRSLNKIVRRWLGPFIPSDIVPRHGPGGVAGFGRCSYQTKYENLFSDSLLRYAFGPDWWVSHSGDPGLDRISETIFVPKSYKSFRTISMEPPTLQYFQQGVWRVIERTVATTGYLRKHIYFRDQSRNRLMAEIGSKSRNYATLDLSAASDSVSYDLVKQVFKGTWLLRYLVATRSSRTLLPDGRIVPLKKFAPMGSALCFPIETLLFAAICDHVTRVNHVSGDYSVYGDDIIVPTQCAEAVMRILEVLGFRVNRSKSFYHDTCWFRESCGGEYCDGFDVTPIKVSRKYASRDNGVRHAQLVELANTAYTYGYRHLRHFFIERLRSDGYIPLFSESSLLSDNYTNYHTKKRWNKRLQRIEVFTTSSISKCAEDDLLRQDESIRYRHWLESTAGRSSLGDGFSSVICRSMVYSKNTWSVKPYEELDQPFIDHALGRDKSPSR